MPRRHAARMNRLLRLAALLLLALLPLLASAKTAPSPDIERLIQRVEHAQGVVFIRNGSEHTAAEAAAHLRRKLGAAHGRITTAEQFIDVLGTKSSMTGQVYRVRLANGRTIDSAVWLRQLLREVRPQPPRASATPAVRAPSH